ncbi:hypothetical protein VTI28DRAFT_270 [Corynascus sepedonium]
MTVSSHFAIPFFSLIESEVLHRKRKIYYVTVYCILRRASSQGIYRRTALYLVFCCERHQALKPRGGERCCSSCGSDPPVEPSSLDALGQPIFKSTPTSMTPLVELKCWKVNSHGSTVTLNDRGLRWGFWVHQDTNSDQLISEKLLSDEVFRITVPRVSNLPAL